MHANYLTRMVVGSLIEESAKKRRPRGHAFAEVAPGACFARDDTSDDELQRRHRFEQEPGPTRRVVATTGPAC